MTRWQRFLCLIGWHDWVYQDEVWNGESFFDHRECRRCGHGQTFVAVPAAPGGYTTWVDDDRF